MNADNECIFISIIVVVDVVVIGAPVVLGQEESIVTLKTF
jgi:hypothetical protein